MIEANHDDAGMIWPAAVAPFDVGIVNLKVGDAGTDGACKQAIAAFAKAGLETLYDDATSAPAPSSRPWTSSAFPLN